MIATHSRTPGTTDLPHGYWLAKMLILFNHRVEAVVYSCLVLQFKTNDCNKKPSTKLKTFFKSKQNLNVKNSLQYIYIHKPLHNQTAVPQETNISRSTQYLWLLRSAVILWEAWQN